MCCLTLFDSLLFRASVMALFSGLLNETGAILMQSFISVIMNIAAILIARHLLE